MRKVLMGVLLMVAATVATAGAQAPVALPGGSFMLFYRTGAMYDTNKATVLVQSLEDKSRAIAWSCISGEVQVMMAHSSLRGDRDNEVVVMYRFYNEPASPAAYWGLAANDGRASFPKQPIVSARFTDQARRHWQVLVQVVDPMDGETITSTFPLQGSSAALSRLPCVHR